MKQLILAILMVTVLISCFKERRSDKAAGKKLFMAMTIPT
jgi:hypothetical protein